MSRPDYLIIVTHAGQTGLELFSAHYTEADARVMLTRMQRLLAPAGSRAHLIHVPETEGVADVGELPPLPPAQDAEPADPSVPPKVKPAPFRRIGDRMPLDDDPTPDRTYVGASA